MKNKFSLLASFLLGFITITAFAQTLKTPVKSPFQSIKQTIGLSDVTIEYSRPSVRNRKVYGDLVPFKKIWRTGANSATKITFQEEVKVAGSILPAGTYAIYTIPDQGSWEIMFYKDLTLGGNTSEYKAENEVLKISLNTQELKDKVETFTIAFADLTANSANIELNWEFTRVSIPLAFDIDKKIMTDIDNIMSADKRPYYQAANYYYENDKDLNKAMEWINKAVEQDASAYWVFLLKAKILLRQKNAKAAAEVAKTVISIATKEKDDSYVKQAEKIITDAKELK
jgi:hypothetical protein